MSPRPPLTAGKPVTVNLVVTNGATVPAHTVVLEAPSAAQVAYQPGSTVRDGAPIPDAPPSEESPSVTGPLQGGLDLGTLDPGARTAVAYTATTLVPVASAADVLASTVRSAEDPAPTPANGPKAVNIDEVATTVRRVTDVRAAQPFALVDLPPRSVEVGGRTIDAPIALVGLDPAYARDVGLVRFNGDYTTGTAFLSPAASDQLGAPSGGALQLSIPGRPPTSPLTVPVSAVADLTGADQLFASREPDRVGDFVAAPYVVGVDIATFESQILPALRVDAAAPIPVLKTPPVLEVHVQVSHNALNGDPSSAFLATRGVRRSVERAASGDVTVIDNASTNLQRARNDSTLAKALFLALGLPGAILAGYLAFYGGALLAETERRERGLLRARGFAPLTLARGLAYQAIALAGLGALIGLGVAIAVGRTLFPDEFSPHGGGFALSVGLSVLVAVVTTVVAVYLPARRALFRDVTEARRAVAASGRPVWLRGRLDIVLLLAPWALWLGGALLAARGFLALSRWLGNRTTLQDFRRHLVRRSLLRSVVRRPRAVASGIVALTLAVSFGVSLAIFVATFRDQQRADARFVTGSDVRVTPSLAGALPPDIDRRLHVRGVRDVSPVTQVPDVAVGTEKLLFAAVEPNTLAKVASLDAGFFTDVSPREATAALARDPHAVLVDKETAQSFNFRRGDTVKARIPSPVLGDSALVTLHIAGTLIQFPGFPLGLDFVGSLKNYQQATGVTAPSYFLLRTDGSPRSNEQVASRVRNALGPSTPVRVETTAKTGNKDQTSLAGLSLTGLGRVEGLYTLLISSLAIVLFVVALLVQRSSERAVMRAIGLGRRRLQAVILGEAALVVVASVAIGLVTGVPMAYLFVQILRRVFVVPPTSLSFPPSEALVLVGLLLVTLALSAALIAAALRRMRLVELLRQE
jgi:putative ABC transport system permease protein